MNQKSVSDVVRYNELPKTTEKDAINNRYLSDEIGSLEFYSMVREYLKNHDGEANE